MPIEVREDEAPGLFGRLGVVAYVEEGAGEGGRRGVVAVGQERVADVREGVGFGLDAEAVVSVREIACVDAGCPLVETQVMVLEGRTGTRIWRFTRSRAAITRLIVQQVLASAPERRGQT